MFEKLSPQYQVNKRIRSFLLHSATEQNIEPLKARLIFRSSDGKVSIHLYDGGRHVKVLSLSSILDFFGQSYKVSHAESLNAYLRKIAGEEQIALSSLYVVISEASDGLGAYVYDGVKYRKKIPTLDLIIHFLQPKND